MREAHSEVHMEGTVRTATWGIRQVEGVLTGSCVGILTTSLTVLRVGTVRGGGVMNALPSGVS